ESRDGRLRSLALSGALERELAERVGLCLWRLRRATRYETAITAVGLEEVEDDVRLPSALPASSNPARLEKAQDKLREKREVFQMWAGTLRLLERLPQLPDAEPVDGDDAYGAFMDLLGAGAEDTKAPDIEGKDFLAGLGVPPEEFQDPYSWDGWNGGMVSRGLA